MNERNLKFEMCVALNKFKVNENTFFRRPDEYMPQALFTSLLLLEPLN